MRHGIHRHHEGIVILSRGGVQGVFLDVCVALDKAIDRDGDEDDADA